VTENIHIKSEGSGSGDEDYLGPESNGHEDDSNPDWHVIFGAADYTTLIKPKSTPTSRAARDKTYSVLKSFLIATINAGDMPDAATILHHGPQFGVAVGQLAEADKRAARAVDWLTQPSNPYVLFLLTTMGFGAQLYRNHEDSIKQLPAKIKTDREQRKMMRRTAKNDPPRFTMRILGRNIPIRWNVKFRPGALFKGFRGQTHDPRDLVNHVFNDQKLLDALAAQGLIVVKREHEPG